MRSAAPPRAARTSRPVGVWVMVGVPTLLGMLFIWQVAAGLLKSEIGVRGAVGIARVSLEPDPAGARVDFVVIDRAGVDTSISGELQVRVREPDGMVWQTSRPISAGDFQPLPASSLLNGRLGYSVVVPAGDWARPPRRGGSATVSVSIAPADGGSTLSTVAEERFP